jgi:hypothetical protein
MIKMMLRTGQMRREKYLSHMILYESNISDPMLSKKAKFPNIEKTTTGKSFLLAKINTIKEITRETATRKREILMSILGSPKNSIHFFTISAKIFFSRKLF